MLDTVASFRTWRSSPRPAAQVLIRLIVDLSDYRKVVRAHRKQSYRCFLPDLAGFTRLLLPEP
jgi:hypothetical protein